MVSLEPRNETRTPSHAPGAGCCPDLISVDLKNHTFTLELFLEVSWEVAKETIHEGDYQDSLMGRDCFLDVDGFETQFPYHRKPERRKWSPRLEFQNLVKLEDDSTSRWIKLFTLKDDESEALNRPVICFCLAALGEFREHFELEDFPFDSQDLQIRVISRHRELPLEPNRSQKYRPVIPHREFLCSEEYEMASYQNCTSCRSHEFLSSERITYPFLVFSLKIGRRPQYYFWSVVLPMGMLVWIGFSTFILDAKELSSRLEIILTVLLAAEAYKLHVGESLPKCQYLTWLDRFLLRCFLLLILITVEVSQPAASLSPPPSPAASAASSCLHRLWRPYHFPAVFRPPDTPTHSLCLSVSCGRVWSGVVE